MVGSLLCPIGDAPRSNTDRQDNDNRTYPLLTCQLFAEQDAASSDTEKGDEVDVLACDGCWCVLEAGEVQPECDPVIEAA